MLELIDEIRRIERESAFDNMTESMAQLRCNSQRFPHPERCVSVYDVAAIVEPLCGLAEAIAMLDENVCAEELALLICDALCAKDS